MKTFKIPYRASSDDEIELLKLRKMQSIVIRTAYNQCFEGNSNDKSQHGRVFQTTRGRFLQSKI
jgi:hypothetical protein